MSDQALGGAPSAASASLPVPAAPASNPFSALPFPVPGDRIRAEDFTRLSQSLRNLYDAYVLSSALCGRAFGEARAILASQQYEIVRAMSVFGTEMSSPADASLDSRKVVQVVPVAPGEKQVIVILTEVVETRRFAPNLMGLTYREATERLRAHLGDVAYTGGTVVTPQLVGMTAAEAASALTQR